MAKIFISYRRADSNKESRLIYDALVERFGEQNIFRDKDRIPKGVDFRKTIEQYIFNSDEMLVVIGEKWLDIRENDDPSKRRLDNPEDFVRIEVDMGLRQMDYVTPVVVQNTSMPSEEELPRRLVQLGFQNAYFLRPDHFDADLQVLVDDIARRHNVPEQLEQEASKPSLVRPIASGIIGFVIIIAIVLGLMNVFNGGNEGETQVAISPERPLTGQERLATVNAERTELSLTEQVYNATAAVEQVQNTTATAQQNQFNASETAALKTVEFLSTTPTDTPVPPTARDTIAPTNTPTATDIPTNTPRLTSTPRPTDTPDPIQAAFTPVASNADWTPIEREFDGVTMVLVPVGCFDMGSNNGESDEQPVHKICFDEPFWIDRYEVTIQAFGEFPSYIGIGYGSNSGCSPYSSASNEPRNCVTWNDARNFCEARSARMPTEPEWEYAARGPDNLTYPWGNELVGADVVYWSNSSNHTASVGSHPSGASWVGAEDMSGNVWEWVSSLYQPYPYGNDHESRSDSTSLRVLRGGSFAVNSSNLRAALRNSNNPTSHFGYSSGFRCALSVPNP